MAKRTGKDTRTVKPRMGHLPILRKHTVERNATKYNRTAAKRDLRAQVS